jgi:hypothetical protein
MTDNSWSSASEKFNLNVSLDEGLRVKLGRLSVRQARDAQLEQALERGRLYQLRQKHAQILQQRSLSRHLVSEPIASKPWHVISS